MKELSMLFKASLLAVALAMAFVPLTACEREEGPLEELGEDLDRAGEDAGDALEEAADDVEDAVD